MTYFIHHVQTYLNVNNKGKEMCEHIRYFEGLIITDDVALDALKCDIEAKVKELNEKYPRMKPMTYDGDYLDRDSGQISVKSENDYYKPVCFLSYKKVRGHYSFGEGIYLGQKAIEAKEPVPGVCRVCGCTEDDPCFNPKEGNCWWADDSETLCSHCANTDICLDPETEHCINSKGGQV